MGPEHDDLSYGLYLLSTFLTAGISVVGTNLLCHRYLLQKAKVMVKMSVSILRIKSPFLQPLSTFPTCLTSPDQLSQPALYVLCLAHAIESTRLTILLFDGWQVWRGPSSGKPALSTSLPWQLWWRKSMELQDWSLAPWAASLSSLWTPPFRP